MQTNSVSSELRRGSSERARLLFWLYALSLLYCACTGVVCAEEDLQLNQATQASKLVPLEQALETRGDLSLQNTTIQKALFTIGATWGVNIVVGKDVDGNVSCIYTQAPLREVLDAILLANGYSYRAVGQSLVVQKTQEVGSANPLFKSAAIAITHSDLQEVVQGANLLLSSHGQLQALESSNSILVVDFDDRVESIRSFVQQMDAAAAKSTGGIPAESYKRLQVAYFHTQYIPVDNAKAPISSVLSATGKVATMPAENRLVVVDYPSNIEMVKRVLTKIDQPRPQVRITALIYDISLQDVEQLGLNWNYIAKGNNLDSNGDPQQALTFDSTTIVPAASGSPGTTLTVKSLTRNFDITSVADLLQNAKDARLLADPHVIVEENEMANMDSVQEIPFQQITQSELGGQIGTTAFKKVGIKLGVTPQIAADGTVKMLVTQEFSRVAGFTENDNQPIIDSRTANTTVRVANKQTLVIGGLRQRFDTGSFSGVPLLKDIKYIGPLFRARDTNVRESELIVFIQPEIIGYDHPLNYRECLASETVNCRLNSVPVAEGCPAPRNCGPSAFVPVPFPPVGDDGVDAQHAAEQLPAVGEDAPFRAGFEDRFRSADPSSPTAHRLIESNKIRDRKVDKPSYWQRVFKK